jgi:FtsP/CotA-like multicopper oxidase with cupredoxin domain
VIGGAVAGTEYSSATINGQREPEPQAARAGMRYRLRFINITPDATVQLQLVQEGALQRWTPIANDGADLPDALRVEQPARLRFSAGQTYDFEWTPSSPGDVALRLEWQFPTEPGSLTLIQAIAVHDQGHPGRHGPAPPDAPGARLREGARGQAEPD